MPKIVPIVEGDGEADALPILLRKILKEMQRWDVQIALPKNAHGCANLEKPGGLERFVRLAWMEPDCSAVLILMDADARCPRELTEGFAGRIVALGLHQTVVIVVAKCEYEVWFLASIETIAGNDLKGRQGLQAGVQFTGDVEAKRGIKEWISSQLPANRSYKEATDQASMTQHLGTTLAKHRSRSFRRLCHALEEIIESIDSGIVKVTPLTAV